MILSVLANLKITKSSFGVGKYILGQFSLWLYFCVGTTLTLAQSPNLSQNCPTPALSRLQHHRLGAGETLASLAQKYQLAPETITSLNPQLKKGKAPVGTVILVPPFNGIRIEVPQGATWQDVAKAYGIRADILFEVNGCTPNPKVVFIPGVVWTASAKRPVDTYTGLTHYPLPHLAKIGLDYGWQSHSPGKQTFFHSGIDLLAPEGTPVLAAASGTVLLVSKEGPYGFLVVIDHGNGRQTRYAQLSRFQAEAGQLVQSGQVIGYVGTSGRPDIPETHLHFEVRFQSPVGWVAQDPKLHLPANNEVMPR